jgi:hypothetical protein
MRVTLFRWPTGFKSSAADYCWPEPDEGGVDARLRYVDLERERELTTAAAGESDG